MTAMVAQSKRTTLEFVPLLHCAVTALAQSLHVRIGTFLISGRLWVLPVAHSCTQFLSTFSIMFHCDYKQYIFVEQNLLLFLRNIFINCFHTVCILINVFFIS